MVTISWQFGDATGDVAKCWDAEVHSGGAAGAPVELGELLFRTREADLESLNIPEPVLPFGLDDADKQVVADLRDALMLARIWPKEGAA
jgi:hypothetical protein